jgi:ATP-binding cassette subfamily B protein
MWFVDLVSRRIQDFSNMYMEARVMSDLYGSAFSYLIGHSYNFFVSRFVGSLTHRVTKFARAYETLFDSVVVQFFPTSLFVVGAVGVLFVRNHVLGAALGVWCVLFVTFQVYVARLRQPLRNARSEADTRVTGALADAIGNQTTIAVFSGEAYERGVFWRVVKAWHDATMRSWFADAWVWAAIGLFMLVIESSLLYGAIIFWQRGLLTIGDFVLIQAYLMTVFDRLVTINRELRRFFDAYADASEMVYILESPHDIKDAPGAEKLAVGEGEIEFENVTFGFGTAAPVLEQFDVRIAPREKVALVGPSGAGKSTVTKLLLRFYDVRSGAIRIDGRDIRSVTQNSLREAIAFVPQEPLLFHRTLSENIRYGRQEASDADVIEAAKKAHCHEFISALPKGYDTYVGERGIKLSGGERQRVAIARAILKNAPILVLDEATSSLDSESESLIQDALKTLMQGKTVIVIAHRLSTIMKMDRILVMQKGRIASEGSHEDLLKGGGLYQKLWNIQAGGFIGDADEEVETGDIAADEEDDKENPQLHLPMK